MEGEVADEAEFPGKKFYRGSIMDLGFAFLRFDGKWLVDGVYMKKLTVRGKGRRL